MGCNITCGTRVSIFFTLLTESPGFATPSCGTHATRSHGSIAQVPAVTRSYSWTPTCEGRNVSDRTAGGFELTKISLAPSCGLG